MKSDSSSLTLEEEIGQRKASPYSFSTQKEKRGKEQSKNFAVVLKRKNAQWKRCHPILSKEQRFYARGPDIL